MDASEIIDISPLISPKIGVWPGDVPFQSNVSLSFEQGDNFKLSSISTTVHLGAHADAPCHYHPEGKGIDQRSLHFYLGPCQVIAITIPRGERLQIAHLVDTPISQSRVLFKTNSFPDPQNWNSDFCSLSPELVDWLADQGVLLVGLDTPSVDPQNDKELKSHHQIYKRDMAILEGLQLSHVDPGLYTLVALPLKIQHGDASPVRAVLLRNSIRRSTH